MCWHPSMLSRHVNHLEAIRTSAVLNRWMVRRLKLDTPDSVHEIACRHINEIESVIKKDSRRANHSANLGVTLYHKDTQAKSGCNTCETETGKTGTNDNYIVHIPLLVRKGHAEFLFSPHTPFVHPHKPT